MSVWNSLFRVCADSSRNTLGAPDMGIFISLHPLLKNDRFSLSNIYPKGGDLLAFDLVEENYRISSGRADEETFRCHVLLIEIRSSLPEDAK
jgi:hypothetical protein